MPNVAPQAAKPKAGRKENRSENLESPGDRSKKEKRADTYQELVSAAS